MDGSAGNPVEFRAARLHDWDTGIGREHHRHSDAVVAIQPRPDMQRRSRHPGAQRLEYRIAASYKFCRRVSCAARPGLPASYARTSSTRAYGTGPASTVVLGCPAIRTAPARAANRRAVLCPCRLLGLRARFSLCWMARPHLGRRSRALSLKLALAVSAGTR